MEEKRDNSRKLFGKLEIGFTVFLLGGAISINNHYLDSHLLIERRYNEKYESIKYETPKRMPDSYNIS